MHAASQLPGGEPTDVDDAPAPADDDDDEVIITIQTGTKKGHKRVHKHNRTYQKRW